MLNDLKHGDLFTRDELYEKFHVANSGGIRPSKKHKCILLITSFFTQNTGQGNYQDEQKNGFLYYTGHGEEDQQMTMFNKSLAESKDNGFRVFYFKKHQQNNHVYQFEVKYHSFEWNTQKNSKGKMRKVIKFKLEIV